MSSVFSIFVQLFFGNFGGIRKKRGFRHRLVYKASRVFEETNCLKGGMADGIHQQAIIYAKAQGL